MSEAPHVEEISGESLDESVEEFSSKDEVVGEEEGEAEAQVIEEGSVEDSQPVELVENRLLERWPLEANDVYSLSSESKRRVLDLLQQKLMVEKNQRKEATELQSYHQRTHELDTVERRLFADRLHRLKTKYKAVFRKPLHRRVPGEEPNYIRIFKHYVDCLNAGLRPGRPPN